MYCNNIYKCGICGREIELPEDYLAGSCCGKEMVYVGESYDQEFIDEQRYNEQQDREYEARHRNDR